MSQRNTISGLLVYILWWVVFILFYKIKIEDEGLSDFLLINSVLLWSIRQCKNSSQESKTMEIIKLSAEKCSAQIRSNFLLEHSKRRGKVSWTSTWGSGGEMSTKCV